MCSCNTILYVDPDLFYNKLDSMKQKKKIILVILQNSPNCMICQILGGGEDALNSPTKPIVAKLLFLFLYLYNNIICEIFSNVFLGA